MNSPTFPRLSERVFAVRAAWRRQMPLRVRIEAVRRAASEGSGVPVSVMAAGRPPVKQMTLRSDEARVA